MLFGAVFHSNLAASTIRLCSATLVFDHSFSGLVVVDLSCLVSVSKGLIAVVYFDQQTGAPHTVRWSK